MDYWHGKITHHDASNIQNPGSDQGQSRPDDLIASRNTPEAKVFPNADKG